MFPDVFLFFSLESSIGHALGRGDCPSSLGMRLSTRNPLYFFFCLALIPEAGKSMIPQKSFFPPSVRPSSNHTAISTRARCVNTRMVHRWLK